MKADEVIKTLERLGFEKRRQAGSHVRMVHKDRPEAGVTVSVHPTKDLSELNIISIIRQAGISRSEFEAARRK